MLNLHGPRRRTIHEFLLLNGCKLVDPAPSGRVTSVDLPASSMLVPPVDLDEASHRDLRVQMVNEGRNSHKKRRQAAGGNHREICPKLDGDPLDHALNQPDIAPKDARLHGFGGALADDAV